MDGIDELPVEEEPDVERECPNCGGAVAVWLKHYESTEGPDVCSVEAVVHIRGESDDE